MNHRAHHYQDLETTSSLMVSAAVQQNWEEVQRLECVAAGQIALLRMRGKSITASPQERRVRLQALKAILRHDAQVRALADPDWQVVGDWLGRQGRIEGQVDAPGADTDNSL